MKIEDIISIPKDAICKRNVQSSPYTVHIDPKSGNEICSWYDRKGILGIREIYNEGGDGFEVVLRSNGLIWIFLLKKNRIISESNIIVGWFKEDK